MIKHILLLICLMVGYSSVLFASSSSKATVYIMCITDEYNESDLELDYKTNYCPNNTQATQGTKNIHPQYFHTGSSYINCVRHCIPEKKCGDVNKPEKASESKPLDLYMVTTYAKACFARDPNCAKGSCTAAKSNQYWWKYFKDGVASGSIKPLYGFYSCTGTGYTYKDMGNTCLDGTCGDYPGENIRYFPDGSSSCVKQNGYIAPNSGGEDTEEEGGEEAITDLIIEENSTLGTEPENTIYTKVSGSSIEVRVFHKDSSGAIGSGLTSAYCEITNPSGQVSASGNGSYSIWSGGGAYVWSSSNAIPTTGYYTIQCSGTDSSGNTAYSPTISFYVAPASYNMSISIQTERGQYELNGSGNITSNGSTSKYELYETDNSIPISKVGETLFVSVNGTANDVNGNTDTGVTTSMNSVDSGYINSVTGYNATGGSVVCKTPPPDPVNSSASFSKGSVNGQVSAITFQDAYIGTFTFQYQDTEMYENIQQEENAGRCSGNGINNGQCPYPPIFEYTFDYKVAPYNFQVELKTDTGSDIQVLYYGQGSSPLNESAGILRVTALSNEANESDTEDSTSYTQYKALGNYIYGCAAMDVDLEMTSRNDSDLYISFLDPTTGLEANTIYATNFINDSQADQERVIKVSKQGSSDYLQSDVDEPSIFSTGFDKLMYFTNKKDDTSYPQYEPIMSYDSDIVVLRGRINMIDADNAENYNIMPTTKVYYEFYCRTCDLCSVGKITGVDSETCTTSNYKPSPTSQGWFIDETFGDFNSTRIKTDHISTSSDFSVSSVSDFSDGLQTISYNSANAGKYQVKIQQNTGEDSFPLFLLYNPYYDTTNISTWGTSSFVTVYKESTQTNTQDFGLDTGDAKNTRGSGRTGGY